MQHVYKRSILDYPFLLDVWVLPIVLPISLSKRYGHLHESACFI